jgi:hypothetical protein
MNDDAFLYQEEHGDIEEPIPPLFESDNKYEAGMFMIGWRIDNPRLPVKVVQNGDVWQVVRD